MHQDSNSSSPAQPGDAIQMGRRAEKFVMTPEWILVAGLSAQAQALYTALLAHVNHTRGDGIVWPGMDVLAQLLGYRRRQTIRPYLAELQAIGAVDVMREQNSMKRRNIYEIHETPPEDYAGARSLAEFYKRKKATGAALQPPMGARAPIARDAAAHLAGDAQAPSNQTNSTSFSEPDEDAIQRGTVSGAQFSRSRGDRLIMFLPRNFAELDDGHAMQKIVAASIKAMTEDGLVPDKKAGDAIGATLKEALKGYATRQQLVEDARAWVNNAGTGEGDGAWLASVA